MIAMPQIGRKLMYKRRERWFLQQAVQRAVRSQAASTVQLLTPADVLAEWDAKGMGNSWANRQDIGDSREYARTLRAQAERRNLS